MDRELVEEKIESVLARQKNLSPRIAEIVRTRLSELDWDTFINHVLDHYYVQIERQERKLFGEECNQLLMNAIKSELDSILGQTH